MSPTIGLPPPDPETCLVTPRVSRYKGGTLIAEEVRDIEGHARLICDPDGYRPRCCPRCGESVLHVHCYPERRPRGDPGLPPVIRIVQFLCTGLGCGATWRILPMFLARHLWHAWPTVERVVKPDDTPAPREAPPIPERTRRRWSSRLAAAARVLVVLLAASGGVATEALAAGVGLDASREALVDAHARIAEIEPAARLGALAALVHRLERGIRLM